MVTAWMALRRSLSLRSLAAVLLVFVLAISFHSFVRYSDHPFELVIEPELESAPPSEPLESHTLTPDGLLAVNPRGPHPIFQLISDAEAAWEAKRARASKTLEAAVVEYRRRYRRAPPLGFDKWCVLPT